MSRFHITQTPPDVPEAVRLIDELEEHIESFGYPQESRHGFSVEKLIRENVPFFVIYAPMPIGCGGIKLFPDYGEIKRMFIRPAFQGQGYAKAMLHHLADHALQHNITLLRLETGIYQIPAIKLYESFGFTRCGPFGEYRDDSISVYMQMSLNHTMHP